MKRDARLALGLALTCLACGPACRSQPAESPAPTTAATPANAAAPGASAPEQGDEPAATAAVAAPVAPAERDSERWGEAGGLRYLELVRGGANAEDALPLVIVLHGLGDRPRPLWFAGFPGRARFVLPQAPTPYGQGYSWFDYRAGEIDQAELGRAILGAAERLAAAILEIRRTRPTRGDTIVTGFSQGGMLSYALALYHPEHIAAAFPIAGALPEAAWPTTRAAGRAYPPIFAVHGTADSIVPFEADRMMSVALQERGFHTELHPIPGVGHAFTAEMSELLEQRLVTTVDAAARQHGR